MQKILILLAVTFSYFTLHAQKTIRILPLGNSITQGENQGVDNYNTWRRQLYFDLGTIFTAPDTFDFIGSENTAFPGNPFPNNDFDPDHEGHWGWRSDEIQSNLSSWLSNLDTPDFVLMHLGSNDCFASQQVASTIAELEAIIDTLRLFNPAVTTLVAQIIPSPSIDPCINELNDSIPDLALRKNQVGSPVIVVDQHTGFDAATETYDGIHPNLLGEMKVAARWFSALQPLITSLLPLELLHFSATSKDQNVQLTWDTEDEIGIEGFAVEKSYDLQSFREIGYVPAMANQHRSSNHYEYIDRASQPGDQFYRLRIVESDGNIFWSNIIDVNLHHETPNIYPSLVKSGAQITLRNESTQLILTDVTGRLLHRISSDATSIILPKLDSGLYLIQGISRGRKWIEKIVVQ